MNPVTVSARLLARMFVLLQPRMLLRAATFVYILHTETLMQDIRGALLRECRHNTKRHNMPLIVVLVTLCLQAGLSSPCEYLFEGEMWLVLKCHRMRPPLTEVTYNSTSENNAQQVMEIDFSYNAISQVNDEAFRRFPNTQRLDLSHNSIASLHEDAFVGLTGVVEIDLSYNAIGQVNDGAFRRFSNMHILDLSHNSISSLHEGAFIGLNRVVELNLGFNRLLPFGHESYSPRLFRVTVSLEKLILSGSNVSVQTVGWPIEALSQIRTLSTLMITGATKYAFPIPGSLNQLTSLRSLEYIKSEIGNLSRWHIANIVNSPLDTLSFRGGIRWIESGAFNNFGNLKTLNFACNTALDMSHVFDVLSTSTNLSIDSLALDLTDLESFFGSSDAYGCRPIMLQLRRLTLRGCHMRGFHAEVSECLPNLEIIAFGSNSPDGIEAASASLRDQIEERMPPKLILMDFQNGMQTDYGTAAELSGCNEGSDSYLRNSECTFPKLPALTNISIPGFSLVAPNAKNISETLDPWDTRRLYQTDRHGCWHVFSPSVLRVLLIQHMATRTLKEIKCMKIHDWNIRWMNLSGVEALRKLTGPVLGIDAVEVFDMSHGVLESIGRGSVRSLASLTHLNLSRNRLGEGRFELDLSVSPNLSELDLSYNGITSVNWTIFSGAKRMEYLRLGYNKLPTVALPISQLRMLKILDLQRNQISLLSDSFTSALDSHHQLTGAKLDLDLRGNQLSCQCDALDFVEWVQNTEYVNIIGKDYIECENSDGRLVKLVVVDIAQNRKQCNPAEFGLSVILASVFVPICLAAGVVILVVVSYHVRWNIKWEYHKQKRRLRQKSNHAGFPLRVGGYDAYVAYASDDERTRRWVCGTLREELEATRPFSLYLEDRNSVPGGAIAENIVEALDHSRCSLWILNDAFLKNDWCDYALHMSLVCHGRDRICIVLMPEVGQATTMPRYLEKILHPRSEYRRVEQTSNVVGEELMWTSLNDFLLLSRNLQNRTATERTQATQL